MRRVVSSPVEPDHIPSMRITWGRQRLGELKSLDPVARLSKDLEISMRIKFRTQCSPKLPGFVIDDEQHRS